MREASRAALARCAAAHPRRPSYDAPGRRRSVRAGSRDVRPRASGKLIAWKRWPLWAAVLAAPAVPAPPAHALPDLGISPAFPVVQQAQLRRLPVRVPDGVWDRAAPPYVLPIFVVASDRGQYAEDPHQPGFDFNGDVIDPARRADFDRAEGNLAGHLPMARRMYHRMLRNHRGRARHLLSGALEHGALPHGGGVALRRPHE